MPRSRSNSPQGRSRRRSPSHERRERRDRTPPRRRERYDDTKNDDRSRERRLSPSPSSLSKKASRRDRSHSPEQATRRYQGRSTSADRRVRSRSRSPDRRRHRHRHRSRSEERRRRRRHRHRRHRRRDDSDQDDASSATDSESDSASYDSDSGSGSDSASYKRSRKHKKHKKSKKRKLKKDKKGKKSSRLSGVIGEEFGKHGILRETDVYTKEQEFHAWLIEVKHLSPEVLNQQQMKQHFKLYMEDYNTASMPHEKYYNMEKWEKSQYGSEDAWGQKMKGSGGDSVSAIGSLNLLRDEEQLRRQRASGGMARSAAPTMTKEQVEDLRRVQGERIAAEKLRKMGYQPKESMGVRYE